MNHHLSDPDLQLLTAFVDGELSNRQRKAVVRLLHRSSEARAFLKELQESAFGLKQLPRLKLEADFAGQVMGKIDADRLSIQPPATPALAKKPRITMPRWAMAAAILLAVGTIGWLALPASDLGAVRFAFKDLQQTTQLNKLSKELAKTDKLHLDVTVKADVMAGKQLHEAFQGRGIDLIVDLSASKSPKEVLVYAENVTAEEVKALIHDLGAEHPDQFEAILVQSMTAEDRKLIANVLGEEEIRLLPPIIRKPSSEPKSSKGSHVASPTGSRKAVVFSGEGASASSPQIKTFLEERRQAQPGTVQMLLVIRAAK